eukprot:889971-Pyramimonas_sp.AAC.1
MAVPLPFDVQGPLSHRKRLRILSQIIKIIRSRTSRDRPSVLLSVETPLPFPRRPSASYFAQRVILLALFLKLLLCSPQRPV